MRCAPTEVTAGSGSELESSGYAQGARRRPSLVREIILIAALFVVYRAARLIISGHDDIAVSNAWWVWGVERAMRLPDEELFQQWALQWPDLLKAANWYYVSVHFPITLGFLAWAWWRRPAAEYRWARRLITMLTAFALVVHVAMPLAPPRMLSSLGFLDTMAVFGPSAYGGSTTDSLANQFAAMPSLHVGWALLIAVVVIRMLSSPWRWLIALHPAITVIVVVATANHYWIDAIAAALLLLVALALIPAPYGPAPVSVWWVRLQAIWARRTSSPVGVVEPSAGSIVSPSASEGRMPSTSASSRPPRPRTPTD